MGRTLAVAIETFPPAPVRHFALVRIQPASGPLGNNSRSEVRPPPVGTSWRYRTGRVSRLEVPHYRPADSLPSQQLRLSRKSRILELSSRDRPQHAEAPSRP